MMTMKMMMTMTMKKMNTKINRKLKMMINIEDNEIKVIHKNNLTNDNDDVDYTQLKVSELKSIAAAKGLTNYKSLKKTPLIELIKSSE